MNNRWKRNDLILILGIICIAAFAYLLHERTQNADDGIVVVKVDGEEKGIYRLSEEQTIEINGGTNILQIKDGEADMTEADCPDKLCVHQKAVSKNGESIICLPNKVVIEVKSSEQSAYDAVTN
ncbi:MAG: NusG domain II-containing protein [Dorea sp.]